MIEAESKLVAARELLELVERFNEDFRIWEDFYKYRANFCFKYDPQSGRKSLDVADIEREVSNLATPEQVENAGNIVKEALDQTEDPTSRFIPPELIPQPLNLDAEDFKYPELANVANSLQNELRDRVKNSVSHVLMDVLKDNDLLLLTALGIDGKQKILDVFIEECQALKEESQYGTSRTGRRA